MAKHLDVTFGTTKCVIKRLDTVSAPSGHTLRRQCTRLAD